MNTTNNYLILFGDLVGSTEVAVEASPSFYAETYSASYRWAVARAFEYIKNPDVFPQQRFSDHLKEVKVAGDEVLSFTQLASDGSPQLLQDSVASAVAFAWITKLCWLMAPYNLRRMLARQFPRDIAVGIHIGPAAQVRSEEGTSDLASLHRSEERRVGKECRSRWSPYH